MNPSLKTTTDSAALAGPAIFMEEDTKRVRRQMI
jgi:hypothetical protein